MTARSGAGGWDGSPLLAEARGQRADLAQLRGVMHDLAVEIRKQRPVVVEDHSGNPTETGRATSLAIRLA
jgi:hypothetical protein